MGDSVDLVRKSLEYSDKNKEKYNKFITKIKYIQFKNSEVETKPSYIIFYDNNNKELLKTRYEIFGSFDNRTKIWIWGWAQADIMKSTIKTSKQILNYGLNIGYENNKFLKTELVTSRFRINDVVQLEIHIAIASYLSKNPLIFNFYEYDNSYNKETNLYKNYYNKFDDDYKLNSLILLDFDKIKN